MITAHIVLLHWLHLLVILELGVFTLSNICTVFCLSFFKFLTRSSQCTLPSFCRCFIDNLRANVWSFLVITYFEVIWAIWTRYFYTMIKSLPLGRDGLLYIYGVTQTIPRANKFLYLNESWVVLEVFERSNMYWFSLQKRTKKQHM